MYPQRKQLLHNSKKQKSQNCLKISADVVVLTGGRDTEFLVTEHDLSKRCKYEFLYEDHQIDIQIW